MKFVADESIERELYELLRDSGYDVHSIREESPGIDDEAVLERANSRSAILFTNDKDFGELVYRAGWPHSGVILLRLGPIGNVEKASILASVIEEHGAILKESFTVISPGQIRIHPQHSS